MSPPRPVQVCARALVERPDGRVLLFQVGAPEALLWITPGGRIEAGESMRQALERELDEELGLTGFGAAPEIWIRRGRVDTPDGPAEEREHIHWVQVAPFEPRTSGMSPAEQARVRAHRWWHADEILASSDRFAPADLGRLLRQLRLDGAPDQPVEVGN